jgi:hypothetical protein
VAPVLAPHFPAVVAEPADPTPALPERQPSVPAASPSFHQADEHTAPAVAAAEKSGPVATVVRLVASLEPGLIGPIGAGAAPVVSAVVMLTNALPRVADLLTGPLGAGFPNSAAPLTGAGQSSASHAGGLVLLAVLFSFSLLWLRSNWRLLLPPDPYRSLTLLWQPERPG